MDIDVITLTRKLLSFNTINPPGNEKEIAEFVGDLLHTHGFHTEYYLFGDNRLHLIASKGLSSVRPPLVFSGHYDTVPPGNKKWSVDPFAGKISDNKIWGLGSSDMKGGLAAMLIASIQSFNESSPRGGIMLVLTAGEELGCLGVQDLFRTIKDPGKASAIIVGEPTANLPVTGHKGALYLNAVTTGLTAHSSMPELGENAIYKAAEAILRTRDFKFDSERDPLLGLPTINVGKMSGGMNINSIPDHAEYTIDIRSTSVSDHSKILTRLEKELGSEIKLEILVNLKPVFTNEADPFVRLVYDVCEINRAEKGFPRMLPYLTDGSVLQGVYGNVPTIILGPGQPEIAHQTDEFCYIDKLEQSVKIYKDILLKWGKSL